ncbi:Camphor 5-monooxygenase [Mycolicibacterium rhodesiae JS60]|nr:Camphor 5-monooxygenase [Mycolicibacterium rhodesiae JS60]
MSQTTQYDPRIAPLTLQLKDDPNPQRVYAQRAGEVRFERPEEGVVVLYRHSDITAINRHPAVLGNGGRGGSFGHDSALIPLEVDGEEHRNWRRLLDPIFAPKKIAYLEDQVRTLARELIGDFAAAGRTELHDSYCVPLPCLTFLRLLGAPVEKLDFFLEFKDGVVHPEGNTVDEMNANMAVAGAKILEYFIGFLAERRAETEVKDDFVSTLLHSQVDGRPITDEEFYNVMFLFMFAGLDTVTSSMSCIFAWLGQHPEERDRLVADPSLIPVAVEELLRYESPVPSGMRYAEEDIDLGDGLVIRAGEAVHAFWAAANVDPTAFADPLTVDLKRGRTNHIAFASGTHRCLGSHLARLELRIAVEELLAVAPDYVVDSDEPLTYDNVAVRSATRLPIRFTPRSR